MIRLCTICVRGGSKGVKNKNIRQLCGKPLLAHTLEQANNCNLFQRIAVSSDSEAILKVASHWGADELVLRPPQLALDTSPKIPAIKHCVETVEKRTEKSFDIVVDLDATSPLRTGNDIKGAISLLETQNISNVITGAPARRSPYFNLVELGDDNVVRLSKPPQTLVARRQDSPPCFDMNASIYVWKRSALFKNDTVFHIDTQLFVMPENRSVDIDTELDFEIVELLIKKQGKQ